MLREINIAPVARTKTQGLSASKENTDWIIKKGQIVAARQAGDILREAQNSAEALLEQARMSARDYSEAGMREGFASGVRAAMVPLLTLLQGLQRVKSDLQAQACANAQAAMQDFLAEAPALTALLDQALALQSPGVGTTVQIIVPTKADVSALEERCRALGLEARVEISDEIGVFSAGWDGHLWEVHVESLVGPLRQIKAGSAWSVTDDGAQVMCRDALIAYAEQLPGTGPAD